MDTKYTDRHVREYPGLADQATAYLLNYHGEFEPLVAARELLSMDVGLPVGVTRMVLNTMRTDPTVAAGMPVLLSTPTVFTELPRPERTIRRRAEKPVVPAYRYPFELKTKWNKRYYVATAKRATSCHILSPERSIIRYYPSNQTYKVWLHAYCGPSLSTGILVNAIPSDRHLCKSCSNIETMITSRDAENAARMALYKEGDCA